MKQLVILHLQSKLNEVVAKLAASQKAEEEQRRALRAMETTSTKMETERLNQHAHEVSVQSQRLKVYFTVNCTTTCSSNNRMRNKQEGSRRFSPVSAIYHRRAILGQKVFLL